jgi:EAL domain-containing protein (putative c-di-GMP-specific phosphodiesterase class I)
MRLALDDFGSGYSSFKYLADLPFSFIKIEGSLIRRVAEPRMRTIVQGIQRAAADLGLITLAEYVENSQIADIVREIGIDWGQGYHFGRPVLPASRPVDAS